MKKASKDAVPPGDNGERQQRAMMAYQALIDRNMTALMEAGDAAQRQRNGRELAVFEKDFERMADLVAALLEGAYMETACALADIAYSGVRAWMKAYEAGDPRYQFVGRLIRSAEAVAESEMVGMVRHAADQNPKYWAGPATWLERRFPQKYGRRMDESEAPKVIVQFGAMECDITIIHQTISTGGGRSIGAGIDPLDGAESASVLLTGINGSVRHEDP